MQLAGAGLLGTSFCLCSTLFLDAVLKRFQLFMLGAVDVATVSAI